MSAADRHFNILRQLRGQGDAPINPDKLIPGLPQNTTPPVVPTTPDKPKEPLNKQKIMAQLVREGNC